MDSNFPENLIRPVKLTAKNALFADVIRLQEASSRVSILYRRGSNSNTMLATERCNSFCIMCCQPPREVDDGWLVDEMLETISLVDRDEVQRGIICGEWHLEPAGCRGGSATVSVPSDRGIAALGAKVATGTRWTCSRIYRWPHVNIAWRSGCR